MRVRIKDLLNSGKNGESYTVSGWIRTRRDGKDISFFELNDGSCLKGLQVVVNAQDSCASQVRELTTGSSVAVQGIIVDSPAAEQRIELHAESLTVYNIAPNDYPLQKKRHSFEFLREQAHLRPRTNALGAVNRIRSELSFATHLFFRERGFFNVQTPLITSSDCEGAGQMFRVTTLDLDNPPRNPDGSIDYSSDFFARPTHLTVSGQLEGECFASALGSIYTFGPTFRAENSHTSRHLAEFWMVEPEVAFNTLEDNMDLAEDYVRFLVRHVLETSQEDVHFFNERIDTELLSRLNTFVNDRFVRISYTEAIGILEESSCVFEYPLQWGDDLQSEHERYLCEKHFAGPVIVYNYPRTLKPFYMKQNDDGKTVAAMDMLVPGVGELIGGSEREWRIDRLEDAMKQQNVSLDEYWWYRDLRRFGTVPHAGFGLGFERMVQCVTGMKNIRDVIPFPRYVGNAEF